MLPPSKSTVDSSVEAENCAYFRFLEAGVSFAGVYGRFTDLKSSNGLKKYALVCCDVGRFPIFKGWKFIVSSLRRLIQFVMLEPIHRRNFYYM